MPSLYAHMMNLVFRCMPQDKPGQPHDYAAERKRNNRKPPRPPKGVTVRLGELDGLSAEFIQKNGNQKGDDFLHSRRRLYRWLREGAAGSLPVHYRKLRL